MAYSTTFGGGNGEMVRCEHPHNPIVGTATIKPKRTYSQAVIAARRRFSQYTASGTYIDGPRSALGKSSGNFPANAMMHDGVDASARVKAVTV
jgi:hypothetical protein